MVVKCLKSIWFWLALLPIIYLLNGFFLLPWLAKTQLSSFIKKEYHVNVTLEDISFNPLTFKLHVKNLQLKNLDEKPVISLKYGYIDYDFSALLKKEIIITTIQLDEPFIDIQKDKNGTLNILEAFSKLPITEENTTQSSQDFPFTIGHLEINQASARFTDLAPIEPFVMNMGPIQYAINNLNFNKNALSIHTFKLMRDNQEKISLASSISFDPFVIHGELKVSTFDIAHLWHYVLPKMPAQLKQGNLSGVFPFTFDLSHNTAEIALDKSSIILQDVAFYDQNSTAFMRIPEVSAKGVDVHWPASTLELEELNFKQPYVALVLQKEYIPNLVTLFSLPNESTHQASTDTNTSAKPWAFSLQSVKLSDGNLTLIDNNVRRSSIAFSKIALSLEHLSSDANQSIAYELSTLLDKSAQLSIKGGYHVDKENLKATINAKALPLAKIQPYIDPFVTFLLAKGELSTQATIEMNFKRAFDMVYKGSIGIAHLAVNDALSKPLATWENLSLKEVMLDTKPLSLQLNGITLEKPYINLDIQKDQTTNFTHLLKETKNTSKSTNTSQKEDKLYLHLSNAILKDGRATFKDASLMIPFETSIQNLNGTFSTLDTKSSKPSVLNLEGKVGKYGYAKINGSLLPLDFKSKANLKILFKNIDMPSLTPYSGKFIGYAIKEGKLSMDLSYKIQQGLMEGDNKINLDSLTLGEKIESPDAVNLPLSLAISILKDSKGQIDISLPVSGDLNSPDFKYGAIVWKALGNLLGSVITSPFSLIGSILGIEGGETLKSIDFAAGEFEVIASEEEKMEQYKKILEQKPELKLSITPSFNEELDTKALQKRALNAHLETLNKENKVGSDSYRKALKDLFVQRFSEEAYNELIKEQEGEKRDRGEVNQALREKLATTFTLVPNALETLANQRADAILTQMTQKYGIPSTRLVKTEIQTSQAEREHWIGCKIGLSN